MGRDVGIEVNFLDWRVDLDDVLAWDHVVGLFVIRGATLLVLTNPFGVHDGLFFVLSASLDVSHLGISKALSSANLDVLGNLFGALVSSSSSLAGGLLGVQRSQTKVLGIHLGGGFVLVHRVHVEIHRVHVQELKV